MVLGQGTLRAGTEQEAAIRAGDQADDGSSVTPAQTEMPTALSCITSDLPQLDLAESPRGNGAQELPVDSPPLLCPATHIPQGTPQDSTIGICGARGQLGTHLCSTRTLEASRLKERMAPLLKPQKTTGCVGWKATAHGASSGDVRS